MTRRKPVEQKKPAPRVTWKVIQVLDGITVASGSGPRRAALREGKHYAAVYAQDGPVLLTFIHPRIKRKQRCA